MATKTLPVRGEVAKDETWNAESVYDSVDAWAAELEAFRGDIESLKQYPGTLSSGPDALADWLGAVEDLGRCL